MSTLVETLESLGDALTEAVGEAFADEVLRRSSDDEALVVLAAASRIARGAEAMMIEAVAQILDRSDTLAHADRLTTRHGCRSLGELVQRATRVSKRTAGDMISAARTVQQPVAPSTGEVLPADFPQMREALAAGDVGVDGVISVAWPFRGCLAGRAALLAADEEIAASARGTGADGAPPASADELRALASVWAIYLDQDGAEPREQRAMRKRGFTIGVCRDNLVPVRGNLLPEVAAQLQLGFDSVLNPKVDGAMSEGPRFIETPEGDPDEPSEAAADDRTRAQKQHDALATLLTAAAASGSLPTLGGAAPTLVVSVREEDLATGRGYAHVSGCDEPIPLATARHVACAGVVQRVVLDDRGRIVAISTNDRVFNFYQRRAIALRDGGCLIPGCHVPAEWCEIHHVEEHSRGGPTDTDNGVLVCWHHHRTLDTSGWKIRMVRGVPEVKGPYWWDARMRWRPVTKSPTRMRDNLARRT